jgi:pimeloyl-ACP methyl ester carboxylesterase
MRRAPLRSATRAGRVRAAVLPLLAALAAALLCAPPATAQETGPRPAGPTILLLNGLGVSTLNAGIGLNPLARRLRQEGYDAYVDSHAMGRSAGMVPDVIIGHSMGGVAALRYAAYLVANGAPEPVVITIDAAPAAPPCPVRRCYAIRGPGFAPVPGAVNITARALGARASSHLRLPAHRAVQNYILSRTVGSAPAPLLSSGFFAYD